MIASQKAQITAARTREGFERLRSWLDRGGMQSRAREITLRRELESLQIRLAHCDRGLAAQPVIGIVGGSLQPQFALVATLLGRHGRALTAEFAEGANKVEIARSLLPAPPTDFAAAALRLAGSDGVRTPNRFPFRVSLLSELDVVKVLAALYHSHVPKLLPELSVAHIRKALASVSGSMQATPVAGMSAQDVAELREHLARRAPRARLRQMLEASQYWQELARIAPHLLPAERQRVIGLLWNDDAQISGLFRRLMQALDVLGHASEAFVQMPALTALDSQTGWLEAHAQSVLAAATIDGLGASEGGTVSVSVGSGHERNVARSELAALAAEITLPLPGATLAPVSPAEVVVFPEPAAIACALGAGEPAASPWHSYSLPRLFAAAKSAYLFDRALERSEVTSLIVDVGEPGGGSRNDALTPTVSDWVEQMQGSEPHVRQRMGNGLFVVTRNGSGAAAGPARHVSEIALDDLLGSDNGWRIEWTPGASFANYFTFRGHGADGAPARSSAVEPREPVPAANAVAALLPGRAGVAAAQPGFAVAMTPIDGAEKMAAALQLRASRAVKRTQIDRRLASVRSEMRCRLLRHHLSPDPVALAEWRGQIANIAVSRLIRAGERGRLGRLLSRLLPSERELEIVVGALDQRHEATAGLAPRLGHGVSQLESEIEASMLYADAITTHWSLALRDLTRSSALARSFDLPQTLLHHVVDEIAIGALRKGLAGRLAEVIQRSQALTLEPPARAERIAAYATRVLAVYVESFETAEASAAAARDAHSAAPLPMQWCRAFAKLVEGNIAAAAPALASDRDRELGEIIALLENSSFEVDP